MLGRRDVDNVELALTERPQFIGARRFLQFGELTERSALAPLNTLDAQTALSMPGQAPFLYPQYICSTHSQQQFLSCVMLASKPLIPLSRKIICAFEASSRPLSNFLSLDLVAVMRSLPVVSRN